MAHTFLAPCSLLATCPLCSDAPRVRAPCVVAQAPAARRSRTRPLTSPWTHTCPRMHRRHSRRPLRPTSSTRCPPAPASYHAFYHASYHASYHTSYHASYPSQNGSPPFCTFPSCPSPRLPLPPSRTSPLQSTAWGDVDGKIQVRMMEWSATNCPGTERSGCSDYSATAAPLTPGGSRYNVADPVESDGITELSFSVRMRGTLARADCTQPAPRCHAPRCHAHRLLSSC